MANDEWRTPKWLHDAVTNFIIDACVSDEYLTILDPCYHKDKHCAIKFLRGDVPDGFVTEYDDNGGLWSFPIDDKIVTPWSSFKSIWCNPPYSQPLCRGFTDRIIKWVRDWAKDRGDYNGLLLINSSTSAKHYQQALEVADRILFFNKRIGFVGPSGLARAGNRNASTLFYFGTNGKLFEEHFEQLGAILKGEKDER